MKLVPCILCAALLMLPFGSGLAANDTALSPSDTGDSGQQLPFGQYVRIIQFTNSGGGGFWQYGTLEHSVADSVVLCADPCEGGGEGRVAVPLSSMDRMQVHTGRGSHSLTGFFIGGGLGLAGGAAAGVALWSYAESDLWPSDLSSSSEPNTSPVVAAIGGAVIGGLVFGGLGAIIGSLIKTGKWDEVPFDQLQIGMISRPGGWLALGMEWRF